MRNNTTKDTIIKERNESMSEAELLKHLSDEDLCKIAVLAVKFENLMKTLNRIADASERIAHSLESLDETGIRTFPNN